MVKLAAFTVLVGFNTGACGLGAEAVGVVAGVAALVGVWIVCCSSDVDAA